MTYFGVLLVFILPPLLVLAVIVPRDLWAYLFRRRNQLDARPYWIILAHVVIALLYTTPWDNYLVATGVWWYDPNLVTGIRLWYVPIEEYTFFVLQTLLTGLFVVALLRRFYPVAPPVKADTAFRRRTSWMVIFLWAFSTVVLLAGWKPGAYLTLILSWALLPILLQVAFGADILRAHGKALLPAILIPTLYLWLVDYLAIGSGTWTIDPEQTTGVMMGVLPLEEMVFFLVTNLIISLGVTLMMAEESQHRVRQIGQRIRQRIMGAD